MSSLVPYIPVSNQALVLLDDPETKHPEHPDIDVAGLTWMVFGEFLMCSAPVRFKNSPKWYQPNLPFVRKDAPPLEQLAYPHGMSHSMPCELIVAARCHIYHHYFSDEQRETYML